MNHSRHARRSKRIFFVTIAAFIALGGVIDKPGGGIGIHGTKPKLAALSRAWIRLSSATGLGQVWGPTDGCIGISNENVVTLYSLVPVGAKVTIVP